MRLVNVEHQDLAVAFYFPTHPTLWSRTFCCTPPSSARDGYFDFGVVRHEYPYAQIGEATILVPQERVPLLNWSIG